MSGNPYGYKAFSESHALGFQMAYGPGLSFHFAYCIGVSMAWLVLWRVTEWIWFGKEYKARTSPMSSLR